MYDTVAEAVPMAHLSVEIGHLYMEDFAARSRDELVAYFARTKVKRERGPKARRLDQPGVKLSCVASREWHDATGLKSLDTRERPPGRP